MDNIVRYNEHNEKKEKSYKPKTILEMIENDYETITIFIREKRKYFFWIIVFFITLSFVDILSLGASWENACNNTVMKGGADTPSTVNSSSSIDKKNSADDIKKKKDNVKSNISKSSSDLKSKGKIDRIKGISGSPTSMFLSNGIGVVKKAFMMFVTILMIAGAVSVPFLLIIIATYSIIKMVAKHFMLL
jgi:hypothetical protein